jgi:hypothetical protein
MIVRRRQFSIRVYWNSLSKVGWNGSTSYQSAPMNIDVESAFWISLINKFNIKQLFSLKYVPGHEVCGKGLSTILNDPPKMYRLYIHFATTYNLQILGKETIMCHGMLETLVKICWNG